VARPTYTTYAYIDGDTADDGMLGVLCMTRNRPPIGLFEQLSSAAVPPGARAGS
jgi:hypothetical protein